MSKRLLRVDAYRVLAIFYIICAHAVFFGGITFESRLGKLLCLAFTIGVRFTVPFFFILAGYFTGWKVACEPFTRARSITVEYTTRLAIVLVLWCIIYAAEDPACLINMQKAKLITLLFEGTRVHLWFIISLIQTIWLFTIWPKRDINSFLLFGALLYIVGLLGGAYEYSRFGFNCDFNTRNGIFFSTLFFGIGIRLRKNQPRVKESTAIIISIAGFALYCFEAFELRQIRDPRTIDYLIGTVPWSIGIVLLALCSKNRVLDEVLGRYGEYVLGIYVTHILFIDFWRHFSWLVPSDVAWLLLYVVLVFSSSLSLTVLLARSRFRSLVDFQEKGATVLLKGVGGKLPDPDKSMPSKAAIPAHFITDAQRVKGPIQVPRKSAGK
jgi:surface polysaccharide O-acyltransferase-like enzyme